MTKLYKEKTKLDGRGSAMSSFCASVKCCYSAFGCKWIFSKWNLLRVFHRDQVMTVQISSSLAGLNLFISAETVRKKNPMGVPSPSDHCPNISSERHSHKTWLTFFGCWQQNSHRGSTFNFLLCKLSLVGRMLRHALCTNIKHGFFRSPTA